MGKAALQTFAARSFADPDHACAGTRASHGFEALGRQFDVRVVRDAAHVQNGWVACAQTPAFAQGVAASRGFEDVSIHAASDDREAAITPSRQLALLRECRNEGRAARVMKALEH